MTDVSQIARPAKAGPSASTDSATGAASKIGCVNAFLWIDRAPLAWNETIVALLKVPQIAQIHVALRSDVTAGSVRVSNPRVIVHHELSLLEAAAKAQPPAGGAMLFVTWPGRPSANFLDLACGWIETDPRVGTISFLSNSAGSLSFPHRNTATPFGVEGHDEASLTALLREGEEGSLRPTPIQIADGSMVLLSSSLRSVCGDLEDFGTENLAIAVADLSLRGAKRGFNSYLDSFTYVALPWDGVGAYSSVLENTDARHALHQRHSHFPGGYDVERGRNGSVLAESLSYARAKAMGLRVLIDGSALGPKEMGTQLLIMHLTKTLANRPEIQFVAVGVPDPYALPAYAAELKEHRKIQIVPAGELDFPGAPHVDIIHRPYQPSAPIPWNRWRELGRRSIITVQDLIAYRNGAYFRGADDWTNYRDNFLRQVSQVDGVISISHDVVDVIKEECLPIDMSRVYVVENGADARSKDQPMLVPDAFLQRNWVNAPFLFVLGATYAHKNRDLAIRVWAGLREKGFKHKLVFAGAAVPYGSTRVEECLLTSGALEGDILNLPDIGSEERNWLLRNSDLAVYLTSAEGFGQIPFEAARMDVPALFVSFGPLRELIDDPALPASYDVETLVARASLLLTDHEAAKASIAAVLKNIDKLSWAETARKSVESYYDLLRQPPRNLTF